MTWENGPWAVSGARPQDVRDWGKVVLSAAGQPLIVAGEYGQGRVIRSGMNLISHANDNQSDEGRAESAEALWEQLAESGELPSANDQDAERMIEEESRYSFATIDGVDESFAIDGRGQHGHAPYGCSKYVGDMYMQEYQLLFDVPVVINRLSTIYGPHQHANIAYGWINWFTWAVRRDMPITVYGNGKQVRNALHVDDLCRLFLMQLENIDKHRGQIYNAGGGSANTASLLELVAMLVEMKGSSLTHPIAFEEERPADFKAYATDITKARQNVGWRPEISIQEGVRQLWREF